jgi:hypothetical protein
VSVAVDCLSHSWMAYMCLSTYLPVYLPSTYLSTYLPLHWSTCVLLGRLVAKARELVVCLGRGFGGSADGEESLHLDD